MKILCILLFFVAFPIFANCQKHPIYCQILKNNQYIEKDYAMYLSNIIYKHSIKYNMNARLFTAILTQESKFKVDAIGCHPKKMPINHFEYFDKLKSCHDRTVTHKQFMRCFNKIPKFVKRKVCTDFGIGQINEITIRSYDFDIDKLLYDVDYSVEAAAIVLTDIRKGYQKKESDWWTRYNASTFEKREVYRHLVTRFL